MKNRMRNECERLNSSLAHFVNKRISFIPDSKPDLPRKKDLFINLKEQRKKKKTLMATGTSTTPLLHRHTCRSNRRHRKSGKLRGMSEVQTGVHTALAARENAAPAKQKDTPAVCRHTLVAAVLLVPVLAVDGRIVAATSHAHTGFTCVLTNRLTNA